MKTGWYGENQYFVVKPLKNGCRQQLILGAVRGMCGRWYISAGIFSSNSTFNSVQKSKVWNEPTSTNKNPSFGVIYLALEALKEVEEEIHNKANGKRWYIYVDGLDERRLWAYSRILTRKCNYKLSNISSCYCGLPMLYKRV